MLIAVLATGLLPAQIVQDFSTSTPGTDHYVDAGSPFTQHILVNNPLPQTAPNATTAGNVPGYQVTYTPSRNRGTGGGLTDGELFGVVDVTVPAAADNNMGSLTIDFVANPPPSGNNRVYVLEDPDGLATLRFNPVMVDVNTVFSMAYIIANTSYENSDGSDDRIAIYLEDVLSGARTDLFSATNAAIPRNEMWATLTADLSASAGRTLQLVVEFDTNAGTEEMAIDNIRFSSGTLQADWPVCSAPTVPTVAQSPASVCPGVPFRITIAGALNNATEWVIYADAAATQEVGRTSSDQFDVFTGAVAGTSYFIRGEGTCTNLMTLAPLAITTNASGDCLPDATPGTSFEEPLGAATDYFDTGDPLTTHELMNNQGQPSVSHRFAAQELGFTTVFIPNRIGSSGDAGLTDGDALGVSNSASFNFPDGNQGFVFEDTDGEVLLFFTPVDLTGQTGVTVSFDYFVNATSYETSETGVDFLVAAIVQNGQATELFLDARGQATSGLTGLETGVWTTYTYTITGNYNAPIQFALAASFDASTERVIIDKVSFSAGTVVCEDASAPVVSCPAPIMLDGNDNCTAVATYTATATDDCSDNVSITYSQASGTAFPAGETPVVVTATDESGKSATCTFTVTVNDITPPVLTCPAITVQTDTLTDCNFIATDNTLDVTATDNCGSVVLANSLDNGATLQGVAIGPTVSAITWTATDGSGLVSTCTQQVSVIVPPSCFPTSVNNQEAAVFRSVRATPNPFTAGTTISFGLPFTAPVAVEVFDVSGKVLQSGFANTTAHNEYAWYWDANAAGSRAPAGVYFVRLRAEGRVYTQRVVLLK
ncbi:HYR domain-containing protein [Neolewinella lacunae]|uniref:HYR domain-containing protein n=1 Tax=Neolewinella lacunae TaxID=1517758 RepID=A0A923PM56_9BACT|nr:HYR domain-containing protein [Neolewinella lacunae]MBC6994970.1 HYR domain-containing protein [Neolewinella lacunae]MDN3633259.1 HYR domain-containing protein [Neolewinella lacunae]